MMSTLGGFIIKEFKQAFRDPRMQIMLFLMPVIEIFIFGVAISNEVKNIRLWAPLTTHDTTLSHIYQRALVSGNFIPANFDPNSDPYKLLRSDSIDAALVPQAGGLDRGIGRGTAHLQILINSTNVIQAQAVEAYLKTIIFKVLKDDYQLSSIAPLKISTRILYNAELKTSDFMVPGVMSLLMCIITIILTSMSLTKEKESGTFEMLISAPVNAHEVIFGKTIPFIVLGISNLPLILAAAMLAFKVPLRGSFFILMLASLVFVSTTVSIGTLISTFAKNQTQSMMGSFMFLFPSILLSGLLFPIENMPLLMKWLSYLNPLSHFLSLLRNIMLKGGNTEFIFIHVSILCVMALTTILWSFKRFKTKLY